MPLIVGIGLYWDVYVVLGRVEIEINSAGARLSTMLLTDMPPDVFITDPHFGLCAVGVSLP